MGEYKVVVLGNPNMDLRIEEKIPRTHRQLFKEIVTVLKGRLPENWVNQEDMLRKL